MPRFYYLPIKEVILLMRKTLFYILTLSLFCYCKQEATIDKEVVAELNTSSNIKVSTQVVVNKDFNQQIISNGKLEALQKSDLRFKIGDRIARINTRNGQKIRKGDIIAYLDNDLLRNEVDKAQIALDKAESKLEEEKINYGVSDKDESAIDVKVLKNLKFKSGIQERYNILENTRLRYDQTILRARFSGVVANLEAKEGNYITSSEVFCTLISETKMEVVFSVLEGEFNTIKLKQEVVIKSFVNDSESYKGEITEINPIVDENGLISIKAIIASNESQLFDGMNVRVLINSPIQKVVVIPKQALVLRSNREVVFTVENSLAKWNYVEIVGENSTHYALKEGIKINDTIIVSGNLNLSHDARVNSTLINQKLND